MSDEERNAIQREIDQARDGVGKGIDDLDRSLRRALDVGKFATAHAEKLAIGGAVVGFLTGFGFPKLLLRALQAGVPLAVIAAVRHFTGRERNEPPEEP